MTIRKGYVDTPDGQIHYREMGAGSPVVFLHQSPASSRMWEPVLPVMAAKGYRAIALDYPGFGESYKPARKPSLDQYLKSIIDSLDGLGVDRFDAVGLHTGATFVVALCDRYPDRVRKGVLYGLAYLTDHWAGVLANEEPTTFTPEGTEIIARWQKYWATKTRREQPTDVNVALRDTADIVNLGVNSNWAHNVVGETDHEPILRRVRQPILAIAGEYDRGLLQPTRDAVPLLANGRYHEMPGVGGDVNDTAPDAFCGIIDDFLREP